MIALLLRTLNNKKTSIIIYSLLGIGLVWLYIAIYPSIQSQSEGFTQAIQSAKGSFLKAFGLEDFSIFTLNGFMSAQYFTVLWPLIVVLLTISYGGGMVAGEIERGTMGSLLSLPISRVKIFIAKYIVGVLSLLIFVFTSLLTTIPLAAAYNVTYTPDYFIISAIIGFMFGLAVLSVSILFSSLFSEKGKVYSYFGGILVLMYLIKIVSNLYEPMEKLKYASFFYYFNGADAMVKGNIDNLAFIVFGAITVVSTLAAIIWFNKRDIVI